MMMVIKFDFLKQQKNIKTQEQKMRLFFIQALKKRNMRMEIAVYRIKCKYIVYT